MALLTVFMLEITSRAVDFIYFQFGQFGLFVLLRSQLVVLARVLCKHSCLTVHIGPIGNGHLRSTRVYSNWYRDGGNI